MSIGNDVYFDTCLMIAELEHRFTPENGHPSLLCMFLLCQSQRDLFLIVVFSIERRIGADNDAALY